MKIRKKQSMGGLLFFMFFAFLIGFLSSFSSGNGLDDASLILFQIIFGIITLGIFILAIYTVRGELELTQTHLIIKPPYGKKEQIALSEINEMEYSRPNSFLFLVTKGLVQYFYRFLVITNQKTHIVTLFFGYRDYKKFMNQIEQQTSKKIKGKEIANSFL